MQIQKSGEIALITDHRGIFERVDQVAFGEFDGARYEEVGDLHKISQFAKSKSLRIARVMLKTMRREAFA
jgi:hypothetical protein